MSRIVICGPAQVNGEVTVRGAKNAALPVLMAAAAGSEPVILDNMPTTLKDVLVEIDALRHIGYQVDVSGGTVTVIPPTEVDTSLPPELSRRFRYSLLFLGLLGGKYGHAKTVLPGGCDLGDRKFDLHLQGLRQLGAEVRLSGNSIEVITKQLKGTDIDFYLPTTSGTENIMLAACFAKGRTRIVNANTRPEVADMAACLNAMGADITVRNRVIEIQGGRELTGCRHTIMKGWDEALIYIMAAGLTGGEICVKDFSLEHVCSDVSYLKAAGLDVFEWGGNVYASGKKKDLKAFDLFTAPYPGVNSDMQPLFSAFASQCRGETTITDQRFTDRFQYATELRKLGVPIQVYGNCAVVRGPARLEGAAVGALDLRCGAALILTALAAQGDTTIDNCYQIDRGYEDVCNRFRSLGVRIERQEDRDERAEEGDLPLRAA